MNNFAKLAISGAMIFTLGASVVARAEDVAATNDITAQPTLQNVNLNDQDKVVDVVTALKWFGKRVKKGSIKTVKFIYNDALKPTAIGVKDLALLTKKGTIAVALTVKDGVLVIESVTVNSSKVVYAKAIKPIVVKPIIEAGKLVVLDGAYKMILRPAGKVIATTAKTDVVTGVKAGAQAEAEGARATARDAANDGKRIYEVVLVPTGKGLKAAGEGIATGAEAAGKATAEAGKTVGKAAAKTGKVIVRGFVKGGCEIGDSFRDEPKGCAPIETHLEVIQADEE